MSDLPTTVHLAIDLGAGSGRVVAGHFDGHKLRLEEIARFDNPGIEVLGHCHWDILALHREIVAALELAADRFGSQLLSCAICTWGVDFGLLDAGGRLCGLPHQYRDPRTAGMQARAAERIPLAEHYARTGIQPVFFNSSFQLLAEVERASAQLQIARRLLFTPELLGYWLTGEMRHERSICSTSQLFDPATRDWAWEVIDALGIPRHLFGEVHPSGTVLGPLTASLRGKTGAESLTVISGAGHDTAACVAGLPLPARGHAAWISSGTWSLLGIELPQPICTPEALAAGFSNEQGVADSTRLLANISGLWLVQQCREAWVAESDGPVAWGELVAEASRAKPFTALLDPDSPAFREAGDMPAKIVAWLGRTGQDSPAPSERGRVVRVILESLALRYRQGIRQLEELLGETIEQIHIGGGGSANDLLNQLTADACQRPVIAGPMEATSAGNLATQLVTLGRVAGFVEAREVIQRSFHTRRFEPRPFPALDAVQARFAALCAG